MGFSRIAAGSLGLVILELRQGTQGASPVAPGK